MTTNAIWAIAVIALLSGTAQAADLLLYDEDAAVQWREMQRAVEVVEAAYEGRFGIRVEPTYWHQPLLRLTQRTDFRRYDLLEFYIRTSNGPIHQSILAVDYAAGQRVDLAPFTEGGAIDEHWRKVSIPVSALASDRFPLESVFVLVFDRMTEPQPFFLDSMVLRQTVGPHVTGYSMKSNRVLTVTANAFDHVASASSENYLIRSDTDPLYRLGEEPLAVGSDRKAVAVTDGGWDVEQESRLHLLLPYPLREGHEYEVSLGGMVSANGISSETGEIWARFNPREVSSSIKVNQVGYTPIAQKIAYVGNWLGDLGAMPVDAEKFSLLNTETGERVFTGNLMLRVEDDPQSGEDVFEADFSPVTKPGRYQVQVDGIGRSHPFIIAADVYDAVYRTVMRLFYHKRNTTLSAPFADPGYERGGIDPSLDGVFHPILQHYPLTSGEVAYAYKPISGGWFDAGDYGQYVHNAALVWFSIGLAIDLAPHHHFTDGELNIPESGNGVPDILDELSWGMDWALSMQDKTDGGVYWRLCSADYDTVLPSNVSEPRFIYEKTTRATAQFAAMGAIFARLIRDYDVARSASVLDAAERAWDFVQSHASWPEEGTLYRNPEEYPGGGEYSVRSSKPDMEWAAAELYRTTGDVGYQDAYRALVDETLLDVTGAPETTRARWAIAVADHDSRDPVLVEEARRAIMMAADVKLAWSLENSYRVPKHPSIQLTGWHNFSGAVMSVLPLLQAFYLSGAVTYAGHAWLLPNVTLGANPLSMSFITGVGAKAPMDPMDRISLEDNMKAPVRGMPVPGPTWHLPAFREPYVSANEAYYPPETPETEGDYVNAYPVLRRYTDAHALIPMNEGTIREAALTAVAFGLLRNSDSPHATADVLYAWHPGAPKRARVLFLTDIPVSDIPLLRKDQITAFGSSVGVAHPDWLRALSLEQVTAIDAPTVAYWVAKLDLEQQLALTREQIAGFQQWSLFTALPPEQVSNIPPEKIAELGSAIVNTTPEWKAALTAEQIAAMTAEQLAILDKAGL